MIQKLFLMLGLFLHFYLPAAQDLRPLDSFVQELRQKYKIPGIAVGIVKNGEVIYAKGFGYRDREKKLPVTTATLFGLGSTSKAFTGISAAMMVDAGKLNWDDTVKSHLRNFSLNDPVASANATLRDLLTHQTGQARHDMMWLGTPFTREEIFSRLRHLQFNLHFREQYQYSNLMFMSAGHLVERVTGISWEQFVQQRIFTALEMNSSNTSTLVSQQQSDFALPYTDVGSEVVRRNLRVLDNMGPAGSINSNIVDMTRWLKFQLSGLGANGRRLVSRESFFESHRPQVNVPNATYDRFSEFTQSRYAFGWTVHSYRKTSLIRHGGSIGGFLATVATLPDINAGVVVLQNSDNFDTNSFIALRAYDLLLGLMPIDWIARLHDEKKSSAKYSSGMIEDYVDANAESNFTAENLPSNGASVGKYAPDPGQKNFAENDSNHLLGFGKPPQQTSLTTYTGSFENAGYGRVRVSVSNGVLKLKFNDWTTSLKRKDGNTFESIGPNYGGDVVYTQDDRGKIISLKMNLEPTVASIDFVKL